MTLYLQALALLFAWAGGHSYRGLRDTGEWFYCYSTPTFIMASIACAVLVHTAH